MNNGGPEDIERIAADFAGRIRACIRAGDHATAERLRSEMLVALNSAPAVAASRHKYAEGAPAATILRTRGPIDMAEGAKAERRQRVEAALSWSAHKMLAAVDGYMERFQSSQFRVPSARAKALGVIEEARSTFGEEQLTAVDRDRITHAWCERRCG